MRLDRNLADLHTLALTYRGPLPGRYTALVARRAEIYRIQSASFRTSGKEIVTRFGQGVSTSIALRQRVQQCLRLLQVRGVKALGEPVVDPCQQLTGVFTLPLTRP